MAVEISVDPFGMDWAEQLKAEVRGFVAAWEAGDPAAIAAAAERLRGLVALLDGENAAAEGGRVG